jgi:hypothetical protein
MQMYNPENERIKRAYFITFAKPTNGRNQVSMAWAPE